MRGRHNIVSEFGVCGNHNPFGIAGIHAGQLAFRFSGHTASLVALLRADRLLDLDPSG
jgi:hypothetical protein